MPIDMAHSIEPNSEQVNAEDLLAGPRTVTITGVKTGTTEQPVFIELIEFPGRTYRPGKSMRRVLVAGWGTDATAYVGRRLTIYNDPHVKWAGQEVGGIRIAAMSNIPETLTLALTVTRGKRAPFVVKPLDGGVDELSAALIESMTLSELQAAWENVRTAGLSANPDLIQLKDERKSKLAKTARDESAVSESARLAFETPGADDV